MHHSQNMEIWFLAAIIHELKLYVGNLLCDYKFI